LSIEISERDVLALYGRLKEEGEASGYHLNPDNENTMQLVEGLAVNTARYGYPLCPCRLTRGGREADIDIICPCDYRDDDLDEFDTCY
jgi:ferredoxin-thioredoxin reductase catalytic subunit